MVTSYPHRVAEADEHATIGAPEAESIGTRLFDRVHRLLCGFHGHDNLLQFERDRMFLRCVSCGHETPGWELTETPPIVSAAARTDERQRVVMGRQLISARRIA